MQQLTKARTIIEYEQISKFNKKHRGCSVSLAFHVLPDWQHRQRILDSMDNDLYDILLTETYHGCMSPHHVQSPPCTLYMDFANGCEN